MGEIYNNSRETIIWLGEQTDNDDVGERFLAPCTRPEDEEIRRKGGPPRIAWRGDWNDAHLLNLYLWDYSHLGKANAAHAPSLWGTNLEVKLPQNDIFGAFCLIQSLARGDSSTTINFLEKPVFDPNQAHTPPIGYYDPEQANQYLRGSRSSRVWAGLERLMNRPWWSRIWVIQETVLAQKATVHFGMLSAPWTMFAGAAAHFDQERHRLCLELSGQVSGYELLSRFSSSVLQIDNTRQQRQDLRIVSLLSLLWKFRSLESSDKRDKVFALVGLASDWLGTSPMQPNYEFEVGEAFLNTALTMIRHSGDLSILAGDLEPRFGRKRWKGLPSWVQDWSLPCLQHEIDRVNSLTMYNASGGRSGIVRYHDRHSILEVEGVYMDDVKTVCEISRQTQIADTLAVIREWKFTALEAGSTSFNYPDSHKSSYNEAYWRTLLGDLVHTGHLPDADREIPYRRANADDGSAFDAWRMWSRCISRDTIGRTASFTQRDLDEGISAIHYALKTATASRRFFITRTGYMGVGPKTTMPGDRLYVLKNSKVPFLTRPDSIRNCEGGECRSLVNTERLVRRTTDLFCEEYHNCHRLVGDCFAFGLMDGEAFKHSDSRPFFLV
jgi:hypothetical protein